MKKYILDLRVVSNNHIHENYTLLKLTTQDGSPLPPMLPGQFVEVKVDNSPETFLRRPISINYIDTLKNELWLLVQIVGKGTQSICSLKSNDILNIVAPLGKSFSIPTDPTKSILLIGGGVGVAPLLYLGAELKKQNFKVNFLLGARSKNDLLLLEEFKKYGSVYCTTEDGSYDEKGYVTQHSLFSRTTFDLIYTCGPKPMMMAVASYASSHNTDCEVSLENTMACGIGVCLCCVEKTTKGNLCVCKDGPVFNIKDLTWQI